LLKTQKRKYQHSCNIKSAKANPNNATLLKPTPNNAITAPSPTQQGESCMKLSLQKLSQIFLITGMIMFLISYFSFDFENLILNFLMYAVLSVGFLLNFIAVITRK